VICGSFRRDPAGLRRDYLALQEAGYSVLSPLDLEFVREVDGFVYTRGDEGRTSFDVEQAHLGAMRRADLVWLHCPDGYVGRSAAMELGFARALGIRIFAAQRPEDVTLADLVEVAETVQSAARAVSGELGEAPGDALDVLQRYYARAAAKRGWADETAPETIRLLRGEIEELEEALRDDQPHEALLELADVQLYLLHLANVLGADLAAAVREKERINSDRFEAVDDRLAA
jgi:NTP pyrophosphatase (non-canonical NTP hydrolase)